MSISLSKKPAEKHWLTYDSVPGNTLLLWHNHTRGKEEMILLMMKRLGFGGRGFEFYGFRL